MITIKLVVRTTSTLIKHDDVVHACIKKLAVVIVQASSRAPMTDQHRDPFRVPRALVVYAVVLFRFPNV